MCCFAACFIIFATLNENALNTGAECDATIIQMLVIDQKKGHCLHLSTLQLHLYYILYFTDDTEKCTSIIPCVWGVFVCVYIKHKIKNTDTAFCEYYISFNSPFTCYNKH